MRRMILASATLLLCAASLTSAEAAIISYTYTGTVSSGQDEVGLFGDKGAILDGQLFTVVERFDTSKAADVKPPYTDGKTYSEAEGGSSLGQPFFATATVTIGGRMITIGPVTYAEAYSLPDGASQQDYTLVRSETSGIDPKIEYSEFNAYSALLSYDYRQPGVYTDKNTLFYGDYSYALNGSSASTYANFAVSQLVISTVPLPASAPMFAAALMGLGCIGYRRKQRLLPARIRSGSGHDDAWLPISQAASCTFRGC